MSKFLYPPALPPLVRAELKRLHEGVAKHGPAHPINLPSDEVLLAILDVCYHASFLREEEQALSFQVAYLSKPVQGSLENERSHLEITAPVDFTPQQIRRLSPATHPTSAFLAVQERDASQPVTLQIWGIGFADPDWWKLSSPGNLSHITPEGPLPPTLIIKVTAPGTMAAMWGNRLLLTLRNGTIEPEFSDVLKSSILSDIIEPVLIRFRQEIEDRYARQPDDDDRFTINYQIRETYFGVLKDILGRARERSHGALFLMVPAGSPTASGLRVKYPVSDVGIPQCIHLKCLAERAAEEAKFVRDESSGWSGRNTSIVFGKSESHVVYTERLRRLSHAVGDLATIDGAVLITNRLHLLGFGAEVQLAPPVTSVTIVSNSSIAGKTIPIESFGTRHRAAFRFCYENPESVAFVLSQDGGIRVVRRVGSELLLTTQE